MMNKNVPTFTPGSSNFVPSSRPFVPSGNVGMNMGAATFQPNPQPFKKPEPPKEKYVLLLERFVKGSDSDVKSDQLTADDNAKVAKMKESVNTIKTEKKIRVDLLRAFLD